jgi:large subunit ribosomal protein L21
MNGIIEILGRQYNVKKDDIIAIDKIQDLKDKKLEFDKVLMFKDNDKVILGEPYIKNAKVKAVVVDQVRDAKVLVFKYRRKKNYKRLRGHKQHFTMVKIEDIIV